MEQGTRNKEQGTRNKDENKNEGNGIRCCKSGSDFFGLRISLHIWEGAAHRDATLIA
jgi:hypothetical protein